MGSAKHSPELPTLLRTKLHRPPITADLVPRPRLHQRLDQRRDRPLTLICAPAGYGKTTLVSSWLETSDWPSAWLSLDEVDNDLFLFLSYFLAAVQTMFPEACQETAALLKAATLPPTPVLARSLINDLDEIEAPFILALDDYHHIHEAAVHDLLSEVLRHPPRPMHLVLASRREPSIDLTQLRVRSQVTEVRATDLRFTEPETAAFLEHELRTPVETSAVEALIKRVEGWAAGLRLITLSLRHRGSVDLSSASRGGDVAYVTDYLMAEVLAGQPPAIQDFLLKTSILDRLNGPLCDAVTGLDEPEHNGQAYLERLQKIGLFTIPLDDNREWYRYHRLFRQLLRGRLEGKLGADDIAALHSRASAWFAQIGLIDEALRHALAAGDTAAAVELVAQHRHDLINQEKWRHLERWLRLFDRVTIDHSPELSIIEAWLLNHHALIQQLSDALDRTTNLLSEADLPPEVADSIRGEIHLLRANLLRWFNRASEALAMVEPATSLLPQEWQWAHAAVSMVLGYTYAQLGKTELAEQTLLADLSDQQLGDNPKHEALLLYTLTSLRWIGLDLSGMKLAAARYQEYGRRFDLPETETIAQYCLGCAHYHHNVLSQAEECFRAAAGNPYKANRSVYCQAVCGLAFTYRALGWPAKARDLLRESESEMVDQLDPVFLGVLQAGQAEVALAQGDIAGATRWAAAYDPQPIAGLNMFFIPQLTYIKVLLAQNTASSLGKAAALLTQFLEVARSNHFKSALLYALPLQALLSDIQGDEAAALASLKEAIRLGEAEGLIRVFVDSGPQMAGLLDRLRGQGVAPDYVTQILAAFRYETKDQGRTTKAPAPDSSFVAGPSSPVLSEAEGLVEPLTNRELDVLALLAQRLSNKEIAAQLVISPLTVKKHTVNIYGKLGVKNRRQAVSRATELGILPER